jgi:hypothetical protein
MIWPSAKEKHYSENDKADDGEDFQSREPKLGFSVPRHREDIEGEDDFLVSLQCHW